MLEPYGLIEVKPRKLNKLKVTLAIIVVITIIGLCVYSAVKAVQYKNEQKQQEALNNNEQVALNNNATQEQVAKEAEEQAKQEEAKKQEELNAQKEKNAIALTETQMHDVEHIYNSTGVKRVFLTFDDGPTASVTPFILDLLKQENIKATFFVLGNRAKANSDLIKREFNEGHYIGNHGYSHVYSQIYARAQNVLDEYNYTEQCLQDALENPDYHSRVFRFPGGSNGGYYNSLKQEAKSLLRSNNIVHLDWNCLSKDAEGAKTKEQLLQNVINTAQNKDSVVVLMHDSADKILTYEVLPDVINYFRQNGYDFMNLYDIL